MNQKHVREARILNRTLGNMVKKDERPVNERGAITGGKPHKLPRAVKRNFEAKDHRAKGKMTRHWRSDVARSLKARGVIPKGEAQRLTKKVSRNLASRSARANDRRILNQFGNYLRGQLALEHAGEAP